MLLFLFSLCKIIPSLTSLDVFFSMMLYTTVEILVRQKTDLT